MMVNATVIIIKYLFITNKIQLNTKNKVQNNLIVMQKNANI